MHTSNWDIPFWQLD